MSQHLYLTKKLSFYSVFLLTFSYQNGITFCGTQIISFCNFWSVLTPADADEHPFAQLVCGVGEDDGGVKVTALAEHPKEVGGVEIVEGGGDETTPDLI